MLPGILNQLVSVLFERKKDDGRTDQSHPNGPYWLFANETNFHLGGYMFSWFEEDASHLFLCCILVIRNVF